MTWSVSPPLDETLVVSPADGVVSSIGYFPPPPELGLGAEPMQRISVFMSVFDCHVNHAPVAGRVTKIAYKPGLFLNADLDKASENNERNGLLIEAGSGRFGVVQLLAQLGITCQKPLYRAIERDESLVRQWLEKAYPQIQAMAKKQGADIYFGDAAHIRSDHHAGRTWGAKGDTPIVQRPALAMA